MKYNVMFNYKGQRHITQQFDTLTHANAYCRDMLANGWHAWVEPVGQHFRHSCSV